MKLNVLLILVLLIFFTSCSEDKFQLPSNANELLTNNSSKIWKIAKRFNGDHRMNMGDCFLSYRVTYSNNGKTTDNNALNKDCGDSMNVDWSFYTDDNGSFIKLKGDKVKELLNQEKDYKYFKILDLTDSLLVIKFRHKQFGNTSRLITDYLVPENIKVEGRNFHN
ncbi:hypothetical protein [Winogradskyella jejuensis]|uniref:Lipocalin-like domain-containing protein n=1 Tax=Winogradskyella jejuensis TaxID=1089305 RepID=A0A1M5TWF7_9FLAO|nr:hypothetical protein [Winogradskyella jejuensis]SHH55034.1 hypothetical protein SAMN05444148_2289 [Winogradskyella jejuensis]